MYQCVKKFLSSIRITRFSFLNEWGRLGFVSLCFLFAFEICFFSSCTSSKNTAATRWYHSFNTRYNVYFNGDEAYKDALKKQQEGYQETYSDFILMFPVSSLPKDKQTEGGPFDRSIEKAAKAIKTHSIQTKPEKKTGKKNDPKYQEFMQREEYNPFLYNAWLMMGRSQFHNGDFLVAASTFSYTARHYATQPEIVSEAKIWQARCYSEMGWYYEAEDLLSKINTDKLPSSQNNWFSTVYADYLIKQKRYSEAIPYLQVAIKAEKNKTQKLREKYLLGQLYKDLGQKELAYKAFGEVAGSTAPYPLQFGAKIRQTEVFSDGNTRKVTDMLSKMAKSSKNKDYLDQVYYAWGNVYMTIPDTVKAIEKYKLGIEKSVQNGFDKALCDICLGDVYFSQREYIKAQPCYSEALGLIKKEYKDYPKVSKRSEVLDELVVHFENVQLQDSLQLLAQMSEPERLVIVDKIIADYIKKEEEEKKAAEKEEYLAQQENNGGNMEQLNVGKQVARPSTMGVRPIGNEGSSFYFYNAQLVAQGKTEFQRKWGKRKLEDSWNMRNKVAQLDDELTGENTLESVDPIIEETAPSEGVVEKTPEELQAVNDPHKREYYLQNIPVTEEDIDASNDIILDGLYNMGLIYKNKLEDMALAQETFEQLNSRFPGNEFKLDSYYQLYLMYLKQKNTNMYELYKAKIRAEYPESDLAIAMADPNYEYNMQMIDVVQDSIYQSTYQYYTTGNVSGARRNYNEVTQKYPQSKLMPKFMFIDALTYVQTGDVSVFKTKLKELIDKYPDADVSVLAGSIMKNLLKGMKLSGNGNLAQGGIFNIRFGGAAGEDGELLTDSIPFSEEKNTPYTLMLVYPEDKVKGNLILFAVAEFNFSNFMVNDFDLVEATFGETSILQVKGFNNYMEILQYLKMINQPTGYLPMMEDAVIVVPISNDNYDLLMKGRSLEEYTQFFEEHFGKENPQLIDKWHSIKESEEKASENIKSSEDSKAVSVEKEEKTIQEEEDILPIEESEQQKESEIIVGDTIIYNVPQDTVTVSKIAPESGITEDDVVKAATEATKVINESVESINKTVDEIFNDPIRGIQNLFSKKKKPDNAIDEYVKQQEKEEKEKQKQLEEERKIQEKAQKELAKQQEKERKALLKKQQEEEKQLLKAKEEQEKALEQDKKRIEKEKENERKRLEKEKEDARKQKAADAKARQKAKEEEREAKEKARNEARKQKEKEREAARKQKEEERKAKSKSK